MDHAAAMTIAAYQISHPPVDLNDTIYIPHLHEKLSPFILKTSPFEPPKSSAFAGFEDNGSPDGQARIVPKRPIYHIEDIPVELCSHDTPGGTIDIVPHNSIKRIPSFVNYTIFPGIAINEKDEGKYRIRWTPFAGAFYIKLLQSGFDNRIVERLSPHIIIIANQFYNQNINVQISDEEDMNLGHGEPEDQWSEKILEPSSCAVSFPTFFSRNKAHAIPNSIISNKSKFTIKVSMSKIYDIIQMQHKNEKGEWELCKVDHNKLKITHDSFFTSFQCNADYTTQFYEDEKTSCLTDFKLFYKKFLELGVERRVSYGSRIQIDLSAFKCCYAIFYFAVSDRSLLCNYHGNYTTNPLDHTKGLDPIAEAFIDGSNEDDNSGPLCWYPHINRLFLNRSNGRNFGTVPNICGLHGLALCNDPFKFDTNSGINLGKNMKLTIRMIDFNDKIENGRPDELFNIHVIGLCLDTVEFVVDNSDGSNKFKIKDII